MRVTLDDKPLDMDIGISQPLREVIDRVRKVAAVRKRILAAISVRGHELGADELDEWSARPCDQVEQVAFTTACPRRLARDAIAQVAALFEECSLMQQAVAEQLTAGQLGKAMERLAGCLGLFKAAQEAVSQAVELNRLDLRAIQLKGKSLEQAIRDLTGKLAEVKAALEANDLVLLRDLLTYEFPEVSCQWRDILGVLDEHLAKGA
ncbi:MAG: hypothetical protein BIFFINMI_01966 [Phycisphaerae bacterium]|nr:hypothetical protein [Phycisphaerae bacterium]